MIEREALVGFPEPVSVGVVIAVIVSANGFGRFSDDHVVQEPDAQ